MTERSNDRGAVSGAGWLVTAGIAVASIAGYAGQWAHWLGSWSETQAHLGGAFVLTLPAAAGLGAWFGRNAPSRTTPAAPADARSGSGAALGRYAARSGWAVAGYVLGALPAVVLTALAADWGTFRVLPMLAQVVCVVGVFALAQSMGSRLLWPAGPIVVALGTLVVILMLRWVADSILVALTPIDGRSMTFHEIRPAVSLLQIGLWLLIFVAAALAEARAPRPALVALLLAGVVAGPLLAQTPDTRRLEVDSLGPWCDEDALARVCMPAGKAQLTDEFTPLLARAQSLVTGTGESLAYLDVEGRGLSPATDAALDELVQRTTAVEGRVVLTSESADLDGLAQVDANRFLYVIGDAVFPRSTLPVASAASSGLPQATPMDVLLRWYLRVMDLPQDGSVAPGARALDGDSLDFSSPSAEMAERALDGLHIAPWEAWLVEHREELADGSLEWSAFASLQP